MDSIIVTSDLRKSFRSRHGTVDAVKGVGIEVTRGEIFGFLGPNGAGKTTTLRMVTTLLPIDAGSAMVAGYDVTSQQNEVRARIGYVSQLGGADDLATGRANLWDHVRALRDLGTTIFLTTHYLDEADALCDRLVIMDHGEIVIEGTPRDLKHQVAGESVVLSLRDTGDAAARASALVGAQAFAREISVEGDQIRLYVEDGSAALPQILRLLDAERIGIKSMSLSEATLDDVFLRQTGRSLRDAGAAAGKG